MATNPIICINACASPAEGGGLYTYRLSDEGKLSPIEYLPVDRPMYTVMHGGQIHGLIRQAFGKESGLFSVALNEEGRFGTQTEAVSTHGVVACHLTVDESDPYVVNYLSGNVVRLPDRVVSFEGKGIHPTRQEASHTHCVILSPNKHFVLATDLGMDRIRVFDRDLSIVSEATVPEGHGARHIIFSPDGRYLYCVNELAATVSVFTWDGNLGTLTRLHTFGSDVPGDIAPRNTAGAIRLSGDGSKLYISNRGEDTLVVFEADDGIHFRLVQKVSSGGCHPRDFDLTPDEQFLICTNMETNDVSVFAMRNGLIGHLTDTIKIPQPLCVMCCR